MSWSCTLPSGKVVNLDDLPIETAMLITTTAELPLTSWLNVVYAPLLNPQTAVSLMKACAVLVGDPEPRDLTVGKVYGAFNQIKSDLPETYEAGIPKAEDGPTTNGSSGVLEPSAGHPT